ncbi:TRAP transporter large permease subunit [Variovorax sp. dw_954]|uniref:TRAP transporter large permease n=1 Tax=Variovorax sp. dw_954 TaxID=2720078 RepID=UPI001BD3660A|nr:TRAP transporter large permease subunit [Variovorax sp. dw_954]
MNASAPDMPLGAAVPAAPGRVLRHVLEAPAVALILAEVVILLTGVVSRYVFHSPIGWTDELAGVLFLWIGMLGAAIAFHRGEHMRLTFLLDRLNARTRALAEAFGLVVALTFLGALVGPAAKFAMHEHMITTPALGIPNSMRVAALPVGFALMIVIALTRLWRTAGWRDFAMSLLAVACAALAFYVLGPSLKAIGNWNLLVFFALTVTVCLLLGVPIGFAFGIATLAYVLFATRAPSSVIIGRIEEGSSHLILLAVPLFVLLGALMEVAGLARAMVGFLASLLGHVRGGLNYVLLGGMYLVSGISGSKVADMAAVAPVLFPEMKKRGQKPGEMVALLATSGAMAETIPPSLVLITIGSVTSVSISALFTGGLLPALVLALALGLLAFFRSRGDDMSGVARASRSQVWKAFLIAAPALTLPFVIRFVVTEGVATATEVSTIGIVYTVLLGVLVYREFEWRRVYGLLVDTAAMSGAILFIIGAASAMGWALTQSGFSTQLSFMMSGVPGGKYGFLCITIVAFVVLGMALEGIPALVVFAPLVFPIARSFGIHEVQYAMVVILAMGVGVFAPPLGIGYFIACAIGKVPPNDAMRAMWPYLGALTAGLLLVAAIPWISTGFL